MDTTLTKLQQAYPNLQFSTGKSFCWSPETNEIFYDSDRSDPGAVWALLHETGHALLGHTAYQADMQLIRMEVAAWEKAKDLAIRFGLTIDEDHIQDCLDTYRDWLYKRSICPTCDTKALQEDDYAHYRCHNCHTTWRVTPARFARAYRRSKGIKKPSAVFHLTDGF